MKIFVLTLLFIFGTFLDPIQYSASGNETPHNFVLHYLNKRIKLWVDRTHYVIRATFPGSFNPCTERNFPHQRNFLIRFVEEEGFKFVAYIDDHERLLGVGTTFTDHAAGPAPTDEAWYIIYEGCVFMLWVDPVTLLEMFIHLWPQNLPFDGIRPQLAIVGGIEFYVYRAHDRKIVAARLPPR